MQKITTFLTFKDQAEEAVNFYTSIFQNSGINSISYYGEGAPAPAGMVMSIAFRLDGQEFIALNGGPTFAFAQGISLFVNCETQPEIDEFWEKLSKGGKKGPCGWLTDKFGMSWQVAPGTLGTMLKDKDPEKAKQVMNAMMKMTKIEMDALEEAYSA